jgi:hypothetical protein
MHLIDEQYWPTREQLLTYEQGRYASLLTGVTDYYSPLSEYSLCATFLRALAEEATRLEYAYAYDMVSVNPAYLTPADIRRQYAAPLYINKSFPNASQSDQAYKNMVLALIAAYQEGATLQAITDVIVAYTGQIPLIQELYKLIGNGFYDISDTNTIQVSVQANLTNPLTTQSSVAEIQTLANDLYTALDLAKPAHVGLDYAITVGAAEDIGAIIDGMTDAVNITVDVVEAAPLPPVFTFNPLFDPKSPLTQIAAWGRLASSYLVNTITSVEYAALLSDAYRAEYLENTDGTYSFNDANASDILLEDAEGNLTGAVSKAKGVLGPQENLCWAIKSDSVQIFELD